MGIVCWIISKEKNLLTTKKVSWINVLKELLWFISGSTDNNILKDNNVNIWNLNAEDVVAHIHGLSPNPGAWFEYKNSRFKVLRARQCSKNGKPGLVIDDNLVIGCKSNSVEILEIQKQGKNKQLTKEFLLGNKITKGTNLK